MGESMSKAIMFGVGIFVTLMIISGIMFIFSQMQDVYKHVNRTDTSINSKFGEFSMYDSTTITGLDLVNCVNKYYDKSMVVVVFNNSTVNTQSGLEYINTMVNDGTLKYEELFNSIVDEVEIDGIIKTRITITRK